MPFCRRDVDDTAPEIANKFQDTKNQSDWDEPPGRLGEYVRRVKRLAAAPPQRPGR